MARGLKGIKKPHPLGSVPTRSGVAQLSIVPAASSAQGSRHGVKISALPAASVANDADQLEVNQGGTSKRVTVAQIAGLALAADGPVNVRSFGALGDDANDDYPAIQAAIASVKASPGYGSILIPPGVYRLSNMLLIDSDNLHLVVSSGATLKQMTYGLPCVHMEGADRCSVSGGGWLVNPVTKTLVSGTYRARAAYEHAAGIYVRECNNTDIRDLNFDNFVITIYLLQDDRVAGINDNNRVSNIYTQYQDFGIIGHGQRNCRIDNVTGFHTLSTQPDSVTGPPPHLIYFSGTIDAYRQSENLTVTNCVDYDNPFSGSYKFLNIKGLTISNMVSRGAKRGLELSSINDAVVSGLVVVELAPDGDLAAGLGMEGPVYNVEVVSPVIECIDSWDAANCVAIRNDCYDVTIRGGTFSGMRTGTSDSYLAVICGTRNVMIDPVFIERGAFDKIAVAFGTVTTTSLPVGGVIGAYDCAIRRPAYRNSAGTRIAYASVQATRTRFDIDPALLAMGYAANTVTDSGVSTRIRFIDSYPSISSTALPTSLVFEGSSVLVSNSAAGKNPARQQNRVWYYPDGTAVVSGGEALGWQAAVVAAGGTVSAGRLAVVQTFIAAEIASGAWYLTDDYWPLWGETATQASISLKQNRAITLVAAPTFTLDRGYAFNGTTQYIDTNFIPSSHALSMLATNMRLAVYERTALAAGGTVSAGTFDTGTRGLYMRTRHTGDTLLGLLNCTAVAIGSGITSSLGYAVVSRTAAPVFGGYKNGVATTTVVPGTVTSTMPLKSIWLGCYNNNGVIGTPRATSLGLVAVGASLTAAQELAQYNAVQAWATSIGANV